jgi:hypothetical protein
MSVATGLLSSSLSSIQEQFEAALPKMNKTFDFHFRGLRWQERREAAAEARAAAWAAWCSLLRRGKNPLEVGAVGVANTVARHVKGQYKSGREAVREIAVDSVDSGLDAHGFHAVSFERGVNERGDLWRDWLATDNRYTPADEAAFRIDFAAWLASLPDRKRHIAEMLAAGHATGVVAEMFDVTPGAVSQARAWLANHWRAFQGEMPAHERDRNPSGTGTRMAVPCA